MIGQLTLVTGEGRGLDATQSSTYLRSIHPAGRRIEQKLSLLRPTVSRLALETCHSTWHFDQARKRFRRFLAAPLTGIATDWRPFDHVRISRESFVVYLDVAEQRYIRVSRAHGKDCTCGRTRRPEFLTTDDLFVVARAWVLDHGVTARPQSFLGSQRRARRPEMSNEAS
jgi:hypothetical protein